MIKCQNDAQCNTNEACLHNKCSDPCSNTVCGNKAFCVVQLRYPTCQCQDGYSGNPAKECTKIQCSKNIDCAQDEFCDSGNCHNICNQCGVGARCSADGGNTDCYCPPGTRGNPKISCATSKTKHSVNTIMTIFII